MLIIFNYAQYRWEPSVKCIVSPRSFRWSRIQEESSGVVNSLSGFASNAVSVYYCGCVTVAVDKQIIRRKWDKFFSVMCYYINPILVLLTERFIPPYIYMEFSFGNFHKNSGDGCLWKFPCMSVENRPQKLLRNNLFQV